jgi:hypothetical protein
VRASVVCCKWGEREYGRAQLTRRATRTRWTKRKPIRRRGERECTTHKRRQTHLDSKKPEQHDELEPKRDLPHAYGLGAREFRVEVRANGIRSARGAGWKTEEEDARKREERKGE